MAEQHDGTPDRTGTGNAGRGFTIAAFAMAVLSLFFLPLLLAPVGVALGIIGDRRGDPLGRTAALVAGLALLLGILLAGFLAEVF